MDYNENTLPLSLKIASITIELDNIKIIPSTIDPGVKHRVFVFKYGNWVNRLSKKCSKLVGRDIRESLHKNKNVKFYVYALGFIKKINKFVVYAELKYEIK